MELVKQETIYTVMFTKAEIDSLIILLNSADYVDGDKGALANKYAEDLKYLKTKFNLNIGGR